MGEALLKTGETDYLLFAGGKAIATVFTKFSKAVCKKGDMSA
jgi:hypothetical protein